MIHNKFIKQISRKENKDYQCQKSLLRLPWVQDESSQERQQAGGNFIHR